jgi:hypothetical protein
MLPLLRMLEIRGFSLADAHADGYLGLARAAERCRACTDSHACIRWLRWHGGYGRAPFCPNASYFDRLKEKP